MPIQPTAIALLAALLASTPPAAAQQRAAELAATRARLHTSLRAFYFNLARQDWVALTADILPAKVVAHRPVPQELAAAPASRGSAGGLRLVADPVSCRSEGAALVEQATIGLDGDWAEVSVPRCGAAPAAADRFRLIHFEGRWRLVYFDLVEEPLRVSSGR